MNSPSPFAPPVVRSFALALALVLCGLSGCASGSSLVTGTRRVAVPTESVRIYDTAPAGSVAIGIVRAHSLIALGEEGHLDAALAELRAQAARLGANAIVVTQTTDRPLAQLGGRGDHATVPISTPSLEARAYFVAAP